MKVTIGPYPSSKLYSSVYEKYMSKKYGLFFWDKPTTKFEVFVEGIDTLLDKVYDLTFNKFVSFREERKVKIKIDKWDIWAMDHTLALIITPMLKQLKAVKHGTPRVDNDDVPKELQSSSLYPYSEPDPNLHKRWEWVLDEMIFAFESISDGDFELELLVLKEEEYKKGLERQKNGLRLFGKYYRSLWD